MWILRGAGAVLTARSRAAPRSSLKRGPRRCCGPSERRCISRLGISSPLADRAYRRPSTGPGSRPCPTRRCKHAVSVRSDGQSRDRLHLWRKLRRLIPRRGCRRGHVHGCLSLRGAHPACGRVVTRHKRACERTYLHRVRGSRGIFRPHGPPGLHWPNCSHRRCFGSTVRSPTASAGSCWGRAVTCAGCACCAETARPFSTRCSVVAGCTPWPRIIRVFSGAAGTSRGR